LRRPALSRALAARRDLLVDLSELSFADASLMLDLALVARRLRKSGAKMTLRGAQPQIQRLVELVGLNRLPGVAADWPALA
jgi:anti-anti-sigma regulatory factor